MLVWGGESVRDPAALGIRVNPRFASFFAFLCGFIKMIQQQRKQRIKLT